MRSGGNSGTKTVSKGACGNAITDDDGLSVVSFRSCGVREGVIHSALMKISVVTPNYNTGFYLPRCLDSILRQRSERFELELIVVDGGSSDDSMAVIDRYRSELSRVIAEPDDGPADAINKGLAAATGDVLAWLNADDEYVDGALDRVVDAFEQAPDVALCFGHCPIIDEGGEEIRVGITRFKEMFYPISSIIGQ